MQGDSWEQSSALVFFALQFSNCPITLRTVYYLFIFTFKVLNFNKQQTFLRGSNFCGLYENVRI